MSRYDQVPVSEITKSGMSLNNDDVMFMQRMFLLQDACFEELLENQEKRLMKAFAEIIFKELQKQTEMIEDINISINSILERIDGIEKRLVFDKSRMDRIESTLRRHEDKIKCLEKKL